MKMSQKSNGIKLKQLILELHSLPAHVLAKKIKDKEISSVELTETFIERIEKYDHKINSVVVKTFDEALEAAKQADKEIFSKWLAY